MSPKDNRLKLKLPGDVDALVREDARKAGIKPAQLIAPIIVPALRSHFRDRLDKYSGSAQSGA